MKKVFQYPTFETQRFLYQLVNTVSFLLFKNFLEIILIKT